jgi:hypothetical protein
MRLFSTLTFALMLAIGTAAALTVAPAPGHACSTSCK